ncbi:MAG: hypothetical protein SOR93_10840 [Clostridiales Family XIII bacterium]|uniref:Uncharacterized protein n=1 Tax=Hominibacterium faecale TaxID=2839743 RepID=A0A9J6QV44_9FIRM|nr:hypothetical protein [Hominibacterium faecale]MCI7304079.1 hypothetical protein [Clostridia bacterium]MCU7379748.1 hypothetical protein [Hominibacterium faecale]MDY3011729.1 hypothetical protein [Clostridiales Family XIII bacterium]
MKTNDYLNELLGKREANQLKKALKAGKTIIVAGVEQSGKTTLVNVLNQEGHAAVEDFDTHTVMISKPLKQLRPNMNEIIS